jgi:hypothetical protein
MTLSAGTRPDSCEILAPLGAGGMGVDSKKAGRTKTELIRKLLARLNAAPDRFGFPRSNLR